MDVDVDIVVVKLVDAEKMIYEGSPKITFQRCYSHPATEGCI